MKRERDENERIEKRMQKYKTEYLAKAMLQILRIDASAFQNRL